MPKVIHQETMCCGHRKCPTVKIFDDGSMEISDSNIGAPPVKFTPEQAARLVELVREQKEF